MKNFSSLRPSPCLVFAPFRWESTCRVLSKVEGTHGQSHHRMCHATGTIAEEDFLADNTLLFPTLAQQTRRVWLAYLR